MSKPYSNEEREAVAELRLRHPVASQRDVARFALSPVGGDPVALRDNGRSFQSIYHAVRRYDQECIMMSRPEEIDDREGLVRDDYPEVNLGYFIGDEVNEEEFDDTEYDPWNEDDYEPEEHEDGE